MKYWFDTEFIEDGHTIDLISIGVVCEDGREFYRESSEVDWRKASPWVYENVLPHLSPHTERVSRWAIADELRAFVRVDTDKPEFWTYYGDYDWVVLCQLFGTMMDLPKGWPMFAMDIKQLAVSLGNPELPGHLNEEHHALYDALWTREAWEFLQLGIVARLLTQRRDQVFANVGEGLARSIFEQVYGDCIEIAKTGVIAEYAGGLG